MILKLMILLKIINDKNENKNKNNIDNQKYNENGKQYYFNDDVYQRNTNL